MIDEIRKFDVITGDLRVLVSAIKSEIEGTCGSFRAYRRKDTSFREWYLQISISTGGWADNEELIDVLRENKFHFFYWYSSKRGGHHVYRIPMKRLKRKAKP